MRQFSLVRRFESSGRRQFFFSSLAMAVCACTPPKVRDNRIRHAMGQNVPVGVFTFIVLETKWELTLGEGSKARTPQRQFLKVRLSVTNGGGGPAGFPMLSVVNENGTHYRELEDIQELEEPLGLVRLLQAGETDFGWILFDAPQENYLLEVTDGKIENEQTSLVELPLRLTERAIGS
jgi:hypothetical protein